MISRSLAGLALAVTVLVAAPACQRDLTDLEEAEFPGNAEIFIDGYADGVSYQAFAGSKFDAVAVDQNVFYQGSAALRIDVPVPTDPGGSYAGGAFTSNTLRDLTEYNAVTFWARATMPAELNVAGLGNNNTGESLYTAETYNLQLTTSWQQYAIPFPLASKLDQEDGLFFFAEGAEQGNGYSFWIDELQFADLNTIANPEPVIADSLANVEVGDTVVVAGTSVTYEVSGQDITVAAAPAYFDYSSSDESVATVDGLGQIAIVGEGTAEITGSLGSVAATGTVTVTTEGGGDAVPPSSPAPTPTQAPADVISIYSDSYTDVPNEGYARYGAAQFTEVDVAGSGNSALNYVFVAGQDGNFQVIELGGANTIDLAAEGMTNFRFDAYFPNPVNASTEFLLKVVDVGASTTEAALTIDASSTPAIAQGEWLSFDFTVAELAAAGLANTSNIQQVVIDLRNSGEVYLDNIFFYDAGGTGGAAVDLPVTFDDPAVDYALQDFGGTASELVADPTDASNTVAQTVKSGTAETWAGTTVGGDAGFASPIPFTTSNTTMTVRVYSPDAGIPVRLKVEDAGDPTRTVETEVLTTTANAWETLTFDFSTPAPGTAALDLSYTYDKASIFFNFGTDGATAGEKTYLWDDVEFFEGGTGGAQPDLPVTFDDPAVDYALQDFGGTASELVADPADASNTVAQTLKSGTAELWAGTTVGGDAGFASPIPFTASNTTMTVRVYSPDAGIPVRLKVEDATDPTRSVETEAVTTGVNTWETLTFDFSTPAPGTAALDLSYTYDKASIFFNFGTDGATAGEKTYLWDDVEFVEGGGGGATAPDVAAPAPTQDAGDVISLFSDAYTDVAVDRFITDWSQATLTDTTAAGDAVKKYSALSFAGIEFLGANSIDASGMTHISMDVWTPDATSFAFKLVDAGADNAVGQGGDDSENVPVVFDASSTPALAQGGWVSLDVPLADLTAAGLASLTNLSQMVIEGQPTGTATIFIDNIYFYNDGGTGAATAPDVVAPTPTQDAGDVISLFSDAYTDVAVDRFITDWSQATLTDTTAAGDAVKKYSALSFAGIEFLGANSIDASGMTHISMDVWTPDATSFAFKLVDAGADNAVGQGGDDSENVPVVFDASSTPALAQGGWVSLDVPLADLTAAGLASLTNLSQMVIEGQPTGTATVFIDNIYFYNDGGTGGAAVDLPVTFDNPAVDYALTDFGGTASTLVADPADASNTVAQTVKSGTAELWAGTTVGGDAGFASAIPFTTSNTTMTVRVYSPDAGIPVRLKVEDSTDPTRSVETEATTTAVDTWETLTFDFNNEASGTAALDLSYTYDKASIFFNFGTDGATAGEKTYLWDDVEFVEGGTGGAQPDLPVTFDDPAVDYALTDFGGTASTLVADPMDASNTVAQTVKSGTAELWAGTTVGGDAGFASAIPFTASATTMTVRVYSPDAGIPVRLKVEDATDPTRSVETEAVTTGVNTWETLTFDFNNEAPGTAALDLSYTYDKASIFFNFGTDGATAGEKTYLWDDVAFQN